MIQICHVAFDCIYIKVVFVDSSHHGCKWAGRPMRHSERHLRLKIHLWWWKSFEDVLLNLANHCYHPQWFQTYEPCHTYLSAAFALWWTGRSHTALLSYTHDPTWKTKNINACQCKIKEMRGLLSFSGGGGKQPHYFHRLGAPGHAKVLTNSMNQGNHKGWGSESLST